MKEVTKSNGKKYWSKPYIQGYNGIGQMTHLYIPKGHKTFIIERFSIYDGYSEGEMDMSYDDLTRLNPDLKTDPIIVSKMSNI